MSEVLIEKIDRIEALLLELSAKIDNFLGFEEITEEEKEANKTIHQIKEDATLNLKQVGYKSRQQVEEEDC